MACSDTCENTPAGVDRGACGVSHEREAELTREGWRQRTTISDPQLSNAVESYRALGFEVHLEPFDPKVESEKGCTACFEDPGAARLFKTVYTRKTGVGSVSEPF